MIPRRRFFTERDDFSEIMKNCVFCAPLHDQGDTIEMISGEQIISASWQNAMVWDEGKGMWRFRLFTNQNNPAARYSNLQMDIQLVNPALTLLVTFNALSDPTYTPLCGFIPRYLVFSASTDPHCIVGVDYKFAVVIPSIVNGTRTRKYYVNGYLSGQSTEATPINITAQQRTAYGLLYGTNSAFYNNADAYLKDIMIFNRELSYNEILIVQNIKL